MEKTSSPFGDVAKLFEQFKVSGIDMKSIVESRRKDMEALSQASQVALKGVASIAEKQAEFLETVMSDLGSNLKSLSESGASAATLTEVAKRSIEKALAAMRDLAETTGKSQSEAIDKINARAKAALEDIRAQFKK